MKRKRPVIVQVAGTNAKGSVATYLAAILQTAGYKTGLFTSPHLVRREERIRINGNYIPSQTFDELLARANPNYHWFWQVAQVAMEWFRSEDVEIAVMETGLGGRRDPVTVLLPDVNILTPIGLDHREILGDTIEQIALEKCASIRYGGRVVSLPQRAQVARIIETACRYSAASLWQVRREDIQVHQDGSWSFKSYSQLTLPGLGKARYQNAAAAIVAAEVLEEVGIFVPGQAVEEGLSEARIPGRLDYREEWNMLLDGGHNDDALALLEKTLETDFPGLKLVLLVAGMEDKDLSRLAQLADRRKATVIATQLDEPRALSASVLADRFGRADAIGNPVEALKEAKKRARQQDALLVVTGSFYLVGKVLEEMSEKE